MSYIIEIFQWITGIFLELRGTSFLALLFKTFLALLVGGLLGLERGRKKRPAGFRTFMLVCFGAMAVMATNQYVFEYYQVSDPVRLGAQVVSGIGFLGAGSILTNSKSQITGITTAASLWTAACLGLAIGIGFYEIAFLGLLVVFLINSFFQNVEDYIMRNTKIIRLYMEYNSKLPMSHLIEFARTHHYDVRDLQVKRNKANPEATGIILVLYSAKKKNHSEMIQEWESVKGIEYIEEID